MGAHTINAVDAAGRAVMSENQKELIDRDAELYGIAFLVDGVRVKPDRVVVQYGYQASAEPEQEPVAWKYCPECGCEEIHHQEGCHKQCSNCYQEWFSDMDYTDVVRQHLAGKFRDKDAAIEAANQRADAAERIAQHNANCVGELERKLASVTGYVQGMVNCCTPGQQSVATGYLRDILDALLSASAVPAEGGDGEAEQ